MGAVNLIKPSGAFNHTAIHCSFTSPNLPQVTSHEAEQCQAEAEKGLVHVLKNNEGNPNPNTNPNTNPDPTTRT